MKKITLTESQFRKVMEHEVHEEKKHTNEIRKILVTEEQYNRFFNNIFVIKESDGFNSDTIKKKQKEIVQRIKNNLDNSKVKKQLLQKASELNINPKYSQKEYNKIRRTLFKSLNLTPEMQKQILWAVDILKKYISPTKIGGRFNVEWLRRDYPKDCAKIWGIKDFLDQKGASILYDENALTSKDFNIFGLKRNNDGTLNSDEFDINKNLGKIRNYNEEGMLDDDEALIKMKQSTLKNYMSKIYGMEPNIPVDLFPHGNAKLPDDTLIINFSSAIKCPAWNECLVKYVCYARSGEKQYLTQYNANNNRNLMWETAHSDPELLSLIFQVIRLYCVNYDNVIKELREVGIKKYTVDKLSMLHFSELDEKIIEVIQHNKRITNIRLNENGDFIGQWIIDEFDKEAGDLNFIGINTSAYTCRNLNYTKIQNIIINSSETREGNIARFFFALPEKMYNAYDETYNGVDNTLAYNNQGKIEMNLQPLYDAKTMEPNGNLYYKCPCDRISPELPKGVKKTKKKKEGKVSCHECRVCYTKNTLDKPYYVFVKAHGSEADNMFERVPNFGVSKNYFINGGSQISNKMIAENVLKENVKNGYKEAINEITQNAIYSMNNKLGNL